MVEGKVIKLKSYDDNYSTHEYLFHKVADTLVVIFPGGNNSCDIPILYYSQKASLIKTYDVLCISYSNLVPAEIKEPSERLKLVSEQIDKAINSLKSEKSYKRIIFIGRSIGNAIAGRVRDNGEHDIYKHLFISPTDPALAYIIKYKGKVITGSKDTYLNENLLDKLSSDHMVELLVIEEGNHSLETDIDMKSTLRVITEAALAIDTFIE